MAKLRMNCELLPVGFRVGSMPLSTESSLLLVESTEKE